MKFPHVKIPKLRIAGQIYLALFGLILAFLAMIVITWIVAGAQARTRAERDISQALDALQLDLTRENNRLTAVGNWLGAQSDLNALVRTRDGAGLTNYIQHWTESNIADVITVADAQGNVLARARVGESTSAGDNIANLPGFNAALQGRAANGLEQDASGHLENRLYFPILTADQKTPVGVLVVGFDVDGSFLQYRTKNPDQELALVYNDRLTILTLTDQNGKPWGAAVAPPELLKAQSDQRASEFLILNTDVGPYLFKFQPIKTSDAHQPALYGIGLALAAIDSERATLFETFGVGLLLIALAMGLIGFIFARNLTQPIRVLDDAARAMAKGDLSTAIHLRRGDELGDLARQMDSMRQQLRAALQTAQIEKSRADAVIRSMGVAAVITDHDLKIVAANPAAESLLRQKQTALLGQVWQQLFSMNGTREDVVLPSWDVNVNGDGQRNLIVRGRFPLREQPQVKLDVISTPVQVGGESAGYVHILQDASAQEQFVRAKDEFILNAAHELRAPLASLRASIELLTEDYAVMSKQELGFMLKTMHRAIGRFQTLVENLVDMGSIQAGQFRVRPAPVALTHLLEEAVAQVNPLLQSREQNLKLNLDGAAETTVLADQNRIAQVIVNLLSNASKYSPAGEPVILDVTNEANFVLIAVTDHGSGIPPDEQARLFQRFFRGRRAEEGVGIGLGLALAKAIVEAHGGQMSLRSTLGEGSTFWFTLPRANTREPMERSAVVS